jgi:hypothetical protein
MFAPLHDVTERNVQTFLSTTATPCEWENISWMFELWSFYVAATDFKPYVVSASPLYITVLPYYHSGTVDSSHRLFSADIKWIPAHRPWQEHADVLHQNVFSITGKQRRFVGYAGCFSVTLKYRCSPEIPRSYMNTNSIQIQSPANTVFARR